MLASVPPLVRGSLRMAIEGASTAQGRPPAWLQRAADIRLTGYDYSGDDTLIAVGLPLIGEAAEEVYRQRELWDTRPDPNQTVLEVLGNVVNEIAAERGDSTWYDRQLLTRFTHMRKVFVSGIDSVRLNTTAGIAEVNAGVAETAQRLSNSTPPNRSARLVGMLDMIRHSTRSFSLRLDSGEEVRGVMESTDSSEIMQAMFGKRVLVLGRAVYRPSGRLLRIDAAGLEDGTSVAGLFSRIPAPQTSRPPTFASRVTGSGKRGIAAFFGTWPGDESDADLDFLLRELRSETTLA